MEQGRVRLLMREAIASVKSGNHEWARDCLSRVIRADPNHEEAWLWLSAVLETTAEKRYCLERVLAINPHNKQAQDGMRWLDRQAQIEAGVVEPARTLCPMCGEPNEPEAFRCVNCGQDLFVICPRCGERVDIDRVACGNCELEIGDASDGAAYFFHLGELYLEQEKPRDALQAWDKTLLLKPDFPRIAEAAAEAFYATGQRDLAIQSLERAIEESAEDEEHRWELRRRLANLHRDLKQVEEAAALYKDLLREVQERNEPDPELYCEVARFYHMEDEIDDAKHYYEMALALDDDLHDVRFTLAEFMVGEGYEVRALNEFRRLQELGGDLGQRAKAYIEELRPPIPEAFSQSWSETIRSASRYFVAGIVLLLLASGRSLLSISINVLIWDIAGILISMAAGYFLTAATTTPRNLPRFSEAMSELGETPFAMRFRRKQKGPRRAPRWWRKFLDWQRISARKLAANIKVARVRFAQFVSRTIESTIRAWDKLKRSRPAQTLQALPQTRFFQALAAFFKKPFFQAIARFFRRIFGPLLQRILPKRTGPSLFERLREFVRSGGKRLVERAGQVEVPEMQFYRWLAGILGFLMLILAFGFILF
jgi:tetratricopeptide (TPR) repeat protein